MADKPFEFENKTRLLSDDEQELVKVLARFYEHIESLSSRVKALEELVETLFHTLANPNVFVVGKKDD